MRPWRGVTGTSHQKEAPGKTQDTLEGSLSQLAWECFVVLSDELEGVSWAREVHTSSVTPCDSTPLHSTRLISSRTGVLNTSIVIKAFWVDRIERGREKTN